MEDTNPLSSCTEERPVSSSYQTMSDPNNTNDQDGERESLSLEEILYSASSYHAIAKPVCATMTLSALAVNYINTEATLSMGAQQMKESYTVFSTGGEGQSTGENIGLSLLNGLVIVTVIGAMTFGIVLLYKYRCMKCLIGYMIFSSGTLLAVLGGFMFSVAIEKYRIPISWVSYIFFLYNFAIVGVIAIFYQRGIPTYITQGYLVCVSVVMAWQLSHFDAWTAWSLLIMLALYDLCAVLTPCGPLKALVELMQKEDSPDMPGLLYEAELPAGVNRPGNPIGNSRRSDERNGQRRSTSTEGLSGEQMRPESNSGAVNAESSPSLVPSSSPIPPGGSVEMAETQNRSVPDSETPATSPAGHTVFIPLAIAKLYRLPIISEDSAPQTPAPDSTDPSLQPGTPLLSEQGDSRQVHTPSELIAEVEAVCPERGGRIERKQGTESDGVPRYLVLDRNGNVKRTLMVDRNGKVFQELDDDDDDDDGAPPSIKLGLGDFIFYSVLVAKASQYSFTTFIACMLVIMAGLGGTLILLGVYHKALPALPISIFLGVVFYLLTRTLIEPWIESLLLLPYYV
mmetsp:Transcript_33324/g.49019  ORF Transcript_33324/g.49019 Transcript_33324/m.49019 type:complete len:570 (-) Transcript_33324:270-1979(-)|eukprot:CAMPEP_0195519452 /NCGR_PEP_ID=MMETSP0794_2-20130614/14825_1 /TAXON_ID=515487 /ORGANISM="Stephanopyxis turris, Strain CCMP 815" /LENGTH=569 /DNA_ID=CAMNT_0040648609 /DNA_START=45 /DNA_END=1754 /DNA_ORIENTATION=-